MFALHVFFLLLVLSVVHCTPAPDVPYEEQVPTIYPLPSLWPAPTLPTSYTPLPSPCTTILGSAGSSPQLGTLILCTNGSALSIFTPRDALFLQITGLPGGVVLSGASLASGSVPVTTSWTTALLLPGSGAVYALLCGDGSTGECQGREALLGSTLPPALVSSSCLYPSAHHPGTAITLVSTGSDTVAWDLSTTSPWVTPAVTLAGPFGWGGSAVAHSQTLGELTFANASKVVYYAHGDLTQWVNWEWTTNITSGAGGVYDDAVTSLAYDEASGSLYVGMVECLNVRDKTGAVWRLGAQDGLPWGNITSLAVDGVSSNGGWPFSRMWLGTSKGAILFDPGAPSNGNGVGGVTHRRGGRSAPFFARVQRAEKEAAAGAGAGAAGAPSPPPLRQRWRYFYGPRYLVSSPNDAFDAGGAIAAIATDGAVTTLLAPAAGVAVLEAQLWTLEAKVGVYEGAVARHTRLGQVSGCSLPSFGVLEPCTTGPDANDGLWSSLTVGAEAMRFALTGEAAALDSAIEHAAGMRLLMQATGIQGLIARSVVSPGSGESGGDWHNSTVRGLEGYQWLGDASSDEVVGHLFAYPLVANLLAKANASAAGAAREALVDLVRYITTNGFRLIDITGLPTQWGHWEPGVVNVERDTMSDSRGLNSLQMLGMLAAGLGATDPGSADHATFTAAWELLTGPPSAGTGYLQNTLNLKILAPTDDNYSDDELTMLSYAAFFFSANLSSAAPTVSPAQREMLAASLQRTNALLGGVRSALWNAITVSALGPLGYPTTPQAVEDTLWNLRTWPLSLVDWPVRNSHRLDIVLDWEGERNGDGQDRDSTSVLPANERAQTRWNANVHDLDGGSGTDESDPGAFLLSYWAARWAGLLAAEAV